MSYNTLLNSRDRYVKHLERLKKRMEQQSKRQEILERLRYVAETMREAGASEQSIHLAVKGTYEFLKVTYSVKLDKSAEKIIKDPDSMLEHTKQASGIVLSSVQTQQVDWL